MLFNETLGSGEGFYTKNLPAIIPRLNGLQRKAISIYVKKLIGSEWDKDVAAVFDCLSGAKLEIQKIEKADGFITVDKVPTTWGLLRDAVNKTSLSLSDEKLIHHGNVESKKPIIMYLIASHGMKYIQDVDFIYDLIGHMDTNQISEGARILVLNRLRKEKISLPESLVFDNHAVVDHQVLLRCFKREIKGNFVAQVLNCTIDVLTYFYRGVMKHPYIAMKWFFMRKEHTSVLSEICVIRWIEKMTNKKILRDDRELTKILGIQRDTYRRKRRLLESLFQPVLDDLKF